MTLGLARTMAAAASEVPTAASCWRAYLFPFFALLQGWTSTSWLVASVELTPRHGSAVFTAAISHYMAFSMLFCVAAVGNTVNQGWSTLPSKAASVPWRIAFLAGLGWTSTLTMVVAAPVVGIAMMQVLVVSGELLTASLIDICLRGGGHSGRNTTLLASFLVIGGVSLSVADELGQDSSVGVVEVLCWAAAAFGCGACLVVNSLGNTHTRRYLGASNSSTISAFVASIGNAVVWLVTEVSGEAHFHGDDRLSTYCLWAVVGGASAFMVFVVTFVPDKIGFALTFCLIIAGKMSGGLVADSVGISGKPRPVTFQRLGGVAAVAIAAILLKAPWRKPVDPYVMLEEERASGDSAAATAPASLMGQATPAKAAGPSDGGDRQARELGALAAGEREDNAPAAGTAVAPEAVADATDTAAVVVQSGGSEDV